jgi:glutamate/tyrosine decarboxylase-like PLP-dependent enzyme
MELIQKLVTSVIRAADPDTATLGTSRERVDRFYQDVIEGAVIPKVGGGARAAEEAIEALVGGHPYPLRNFLSNALPLPNMASVLGFVAMSLVNSNAIWDLFGPMAAEAEVAVCSMMSKLIGWDPHLSGGYTTWGGQGCVMAGVRLAIARHFPRAAEEGAPRNAYVFASELAHFSIIKSVQACGLGTNH